MTRQLVYDETIYTYSPLNLYLEYIWISENLHIIKSDAKWYSIKYFSPFTVGGYKYNWLCQWVAAEKARLYNDTCSLQKIMESQNVKECIYYNNNVTTGENQKDEEKFRIWKKLIPKVMVLGNIYKFKNNNFILSQLLSTVGKILISKDVTYDYNHLETSIYKSQHRLIRTKIVKLKTENELDNILAESLMCARDEILDMLLQNDSEVDKICDCNNGYAFDFFNLKTIINIKSKLFDKKTLIRHKPNCIIWKRLFGLNCEDKLFNYYDLPVLSCCDDSLNIDQNRIQQIFNPGTTSSHVGERHYQGDCSDYSDDSGSENSAVDLETNTVSYNTPTQSPIPVRVLPPPLPPRPTPPVLS